MNIITLIKQVPDLARLSPTMDPLTLMQDKTAGVINPWDEYAIETGLQLRQEYGGQVTALSVGDPEAVETLRRSIAMSVDAAVLVSDPLLKDSDSLATARILAAAIKKIGESDLIIAGRSAIDSNNAATAIQTAVLLGLPHISYVAAIKKIDSVEKTITAVRLVEGGYETVTGKLPLAISVVKEINEPRHPNIIGIRKASKADIPVWNLAELGLDAGQVGQGGSKTKWTELKSPPTRDTSTEIFEGPAEKVAHSVVEKLSAGKIL